MQNITHVVVLMLENRSFDNLLGWLYTDENNQPPINIPNQECATYDGLRSLPENDPTNIFWNPTDVAFFAGGHSEKEYVRKGAKSFTSPKPDPHELFANMSYQLFGPSGPNPHSTQQMKGFLLDYAPKAGMNATAIMECYTPGQLRVLSALARNFAVCDAWFAPSPTQSLANRAFTHLGTSLGKVDNWPYNPFHYDATTIFNILDEMGINWGVYNDGPIMSLTRLQCPRLWHDRFDPHFHTIGTFEEHASSGRLPIYSFLEPSFFINPTDEHPPFDVRCGENLIHQVWRAVSGGPDWNTTLLIITYDEHGGCYDHVPPPWNAATPDATSNPGEQRFTFNRFGVRVPTVLVSPCIRPGTVFRSPTKVPYDHTSILATLRDWLSIPGSKMMASARVHVAPTLDGVVGSNASATIPAIVPSDCEAAVEVGTNGKLNDLQKSIVMMAAYKRSADAGRSRPVERVLEHIETTEQAITYLLGTP